MSGKPHPAYLSSTDPGSRAALCTLHLRMAAYYRHAAYHREWIAGINANWHERTHPAQVQMCRRIPPGAHVLEIGCGDGSAALEIRQRVPGVHYTGIDLNPALWSGKGGFVAASANQLPFRSATFDAVVSMYVVEHLVFPREFLDGAWQVLKPGGQLIVVAPDFSRNAMASERIGLSYGPGRAKLKGGKVLDALLTTYDSRVRIVVARRRRARDLANGAADFPVLLEPRCLRLPGFVTDCDAVYPVCPAELRNYARSRVDCATTTLFFRDPSSFGLILHKSP